MKLAHFLVAALALPLAACASNQAAGEGQPKAAAPKAGAEQTLFGFGKQEPNAGPCPLMGVLNDNARVVKFKTAGSETFANVAWSGEMRGVRGLCRYVGADPIKMDLTIDMAFGRGPSADGRRHTYRYWVAVTRTNTAPIARQYFDVTVDFGNNDRMAGSEYIAEIIIPRANDSISGANFEVLVGFELTPDQLAYNRAGKRFRVTAGTDTGGQ
jgi:hypothetical protein